MPAGFENGSAQSPMVCCVCRSRNVPVSGVNGTGDLVCFSSECRVQYSRLKLLHTPVCQHCGVLLSTPEERLELVCGSDCRSQMVIRRLQNKQEAYWRILRTQVREKLKEMNPDHELVTKRDLADHDVVFIPYNDFVLNATTPDELDGFRADLMEVIVKAFSESPDAPSELPAEDHGAVLSVGTERLVGQACSTCRGWCCRFGAIQNAFVDVATIQRYRIHHPLAGPAEILAAYLKHCAEERFAGSCVYHGVNGCTLPKAMRGSTCNRFLCDGLQTLIELTIHPPHDGRPSYSCVATVTGSTVGDIKLAEQVQQGLWEDAQHM